jgi:hypothetical protein
MKVRVKVVSVVRQQVPGEKEEILRPEDALTFIEWALMAPPEQRQTYLNGAQICYLLGMHNQVAHQERGDRRGRPRGAKCDDAGALAIMDEIAVATGELNGRELARQVIKSGHVPLGNAEEESVVRRLCAGWKDRKKRSL